MTNNKFEKQSFDNGLSVNIFPKGEKLYQKDFKELFGYKKWNNYQRLWKKISALKMMLAYPLHLEIELNNSCNLKCPMCPVSSNLKHKIRSITFKDYKKIIDEAAKIGTQSIRLTYLNEPLIRRDLNQFIQYAIKKNIIDIIITTNGVLLNEKRSLELIESGLTKINISIDAANENTYKIVRPGSNFNKVVRNVINFIKIRNSMGKKIPKVRVTFILSNTNIKEYKTFVNFWKDKADSIGVQEIQNSFDLKKPINGVRKKITDITKMNSRYKKFMCSEPFKRLTLRSNGDVLPCCSFYAPRGLKIGNWKNESLLSLWNSKKMINLREIHKLGEYHKNKVCLNCVVSVENLS
ncbi:MAG: hypothetical protein ACD_79C01302G0016 [uncultured bacterium]|nr:MAG: hypothetical protein ACD_79C01302G0016 [uncultured bacterium]